MNTISTPKSRTLIDALVVSFAQALRTPEGMADPVALLWTDEDGQWQGLIPKLRAAVQQLYMIGSYDVLARTGPAIWLKCVVDRTIPEVSVGEGIVPILYLPKVSRQELRAGGDCRPMYQPLIELQFRGRAWHQPNGRDWSVEAFLISEGLEIAQDSRTREALLRSVPLFADTDLNSLADHRLDADDFDKLAVSDPVRDLLRWMSDPDQFQKSLDTGRWRSFCNVCRSEFSFDPDEDPPTSAATMLRKGGGRWDDVWMRFTEAARAYPGISSLLREVKPAQIKLVIDNAHRCPEINDEAEETLRQALERVTSLPHREACEKILSLEVEHGMRINWVWAELKESPLAVALEPLVRLASFAKSTLGGTDLESMAGLFVSQGWQCDRSVLDALSAATSSEHALITKVIRTLYLPWLDETTRHFQMLCTQGSTEMKALVHSRSVEKGTCFVFADGLRFDTGVMLQERLESRGLRVRMSHRFSPLPTVTATAKPAIMPLHDRFLGLDAAEDFTPILKESKRPAVISALREEMKDCGFEILEPDDVGSPGSSQAGAWTEVARIDEFGHKLGTGLINFLNSELEKISDRVVELLKAGWQRIHIVTDHGWLLMPCGLPKVELPPYLVATKWARCATVLGHSEPAIPIYMWHWNSNVRIASPPGIACFRSSNEYAHGGVSLQECVVPELWVEAETAATTASILTVTWRGMRCRIGIRSSNPGVTVDLRLKWKNPESSIVASIKEVGSGDQVSLAVKDDSYEGAAATVVALDPAGNILDRKSTTVGEES